jgi:hypothetical protein
MSHGQGNPGKKSQKAKQQPDPPANASVIAQQQRSKQETPIGAHAPQPPHVRTAVSWWSRIKSINSNQVMALFTAGLFFASTLQWKITRDTFQLGNRAYLGAKDAKYFQLVPNKEGGATFVEGNKATTFGTAPALEVDLVNTGNTPAMDAYGWFSLGVIEFPSSWEDLTQPTPGRASGLLSKRDIPKDGFVVYQRPRPLTVKEHDDIVAQRRILVIYGVTFYKTIFKEPAETSFCFMYDPTANDMSACPGHNHMK